MTEDRLAAIRARLAAATEGPWAIWRDLDHQGFYTVGDAESYQEVVETGETDECNPTAHVYIEPDAEFIANAPADIAYLLTRLQEVIAQRDAARRKLAEAWHEGVDAALEQRTQLANPYLLPGEDGPR